MSRSRTTSVLVSLCLILMAVSAYALPYVGADKSGEPIRPVCGTQEYWDIRAAELNWYADKAGCPTEGVCDNPATRDGTANDAMTVKVVFHVIRDKNGGMPIGLTEADVYNQLDQLNADYAAYNIDFQMQGLRYHNDRALTSVSAYSSSGRWWNDIMAIKDKYNESPSTQMNIYISGMDNGVYGVLLGIATFPWDPNAVAARGGLWLNSQYVGAGQGTASHEMGHCLGLWHTHHGVSETSGCSDVCYENAHTRTDANADFVGDFCKDTMPTPTNYYCSAPGGTDCNGSS